MRKEIVRYVVLICILGSLCLINLGCSKPAPKPPLNPYDDESNFVYHRVKYQGETIAAISAWYTKSAKNWKEIANANPNLIPSRMRIGDLVRIPKNLLKRPKSMPKDFVASFKGGSSVGSSGNPDSSSQDSPAQPQNGSEWTETTAPQAEPTSESQVEVYDSENKAQENTFDSNSNPSQGSSEQIDSPQAQPENDASSTLEETAPSAAVVETNNPASAATDSDENQKVREQLMRELLE